MSTTREICPIDMQMVTEYLHENLRLEVRRDSEYIGDMDGNGRMYRDSYIITLTLAGDEISAISLGD